VGEDDVRRFCESADIFVLATLAEGLPTVLMEAMAMELPVVSTRVMGVPELVDDGVNGLLVRPGRVDELADAIERLALDPALRSRLSEAGRQKVEREYCLEAYVISLAQLLRDCIPRARDRGLVSPVNPEEAQPL
jgi:glycosyltransferase involved in cell wall biosynthesis